MPSCQDVVGALLDWELGTISPAACQALKAHLGRCPDCSNTHHGLKISGELTRRALDRRLQPADRERIWASIRAGIETISVVGAGSAQSA